MAVGGEDERWRIAGHVCVDRRCEAIRHRPLSGDVRAGRVAALPTVNRRRCRLCTAWTAQPMKDAADGLVARAARRRESGHDGRSHG